jgi:N-acetylmuramoyl-L-alanine amidase
MKKLVQSLLLLVLTAPLGAQTPPAPAPQLQVAGRLVTLTPPVSLAEGTLVGPWQGAARAAGAQTRWDEAARRLTITSLAGRRLVITAAGEYSVDDRAQRAPAGLAMVDGQLIAALKPLYEALNCVLEWQGTKRLGRVWGTVLQVEARGSEKGVGITVQTSLPVTPALGRVPDPPRQIVDLPGVLLGKQRDLYYLNTAGVLRLRLGQFSSQPPTLRLVTDLAAQAPTGRWEPRPDRCGGRWVFGTVQGDEAVIDRAQPVLQKVVAQSPQPDLTTLSIYLSDPVEPVYDVLRRPYRVLLDFAGASTAALPAQISLPGPFIKQVSVLPQGRLVLEMSELVPFTVTTLNDPLRVQVSFKRDQLAGKRVMVDPGHGGRDPGALGRYLKEKEVNLDVARQAAQRLAMMGAKAYLTRDSDVAVDLYDRPRMTNELQADLFVSVHCNAAAQRDRGSGTQTYYCHPPSKGLAVVMQEALVPQLQRRDGGVHRARFVVVRETLIPAVLVELLFIDNQVEENLLAKPEVRYRAAMGICEGVRRYFEGSSSPTPALLQEPWQQEASLRELDLRQIGMKPNIRD